MPEERYLLWKDFILKHSSISGLFTGVPVVLLLRSQVLLSSQEVLLELL
jgi:hypothetical protein